MLAGMSDPSTGPADRTADRTTAVRLVVRGDVQGVGYRAAAGSRAQDLGLVGWVRNEADGTVALHVEGPPDAVGEMVAWTREGPSSAVVEGVDEREAEPHRPSAFDVRA